MNPSTHLKLTDRYLHNEDFRQRMQQALMPLSFTSLLLMPKQLSLRRLMRAFLSLYASQRFRHVIVEGI